MKTPQLISFILFMTLVSNQLFGQLDETSVREKALETLKQETEQRAKALEDRIAQYDEKIRKIDAAIQETNDNDYDEFVKNLKERVNTLEDIQNAQKEKELNIYSRNYQSAVINLISMERELKPLILFNNSRTFFSSLTSISNPENYTGYKDWFITFKDWMDRKKAGDDILQITSKIMETAGDFSKGAIITGALSEGLFMSVSKFVQSIGNNRRELREKSMAMFELTMILSQYNSDKILIESSWESINEELAELQKIQESTLADILLFIDETKENFESEFIKQNDALKRLDYLNTIRMKVENKVKNERDNKDNWKDKIYFDLLNVQALKIRFGDVTFKIKENIGNYKKLVEKYKDNMQIGVKINDLGEKLNSLSGSFDAAFNPQDYKKQAITMYKMF